MIKDLLYYISAWNLLLYLSLQLGRVQSLGESNQTATLIFNAGTNITLNCEGKALDKDIAWIQYGKKVIPSSRIRHESDGRLLIHQVLPSDEGLYMCQDVESNQSIHSIRLRIRSPPQRVSNFTVFPRSVFAIATWNTPSSSFQADEEEEDLPLLKYSLSYRIDGSQDPQTPKWTTHTVSGEENSFTLYDLRPNSTYYFRIQAWNALGPGESVSLMAKTTYDTQEVREAQREGLSSLPFENTKKKRKKIEPRDALKVWMGVLSVMIILSSIGALGISIFIIKFRGRSRNDVVVETTEEEAMELVPHITLNPSFNIDMLEYIQPEGNNEERGDGIAEEGSSGTLVSLPNG